jgi:hypothetical protein
MKKGRETETQREMRRNEEREGEKTERKKPKTLNFVGAHKHLQ